ncbi:thiamine pyrophosphate-binding protein [soil metagenome]|jgi:acetolactate synthase-1/2/3 large subunit
MKTAEAFARALSQHGVDTVFGVLGDGNMHWVAAYRGLAGCRWRPAWHEAGAVGMADGFAVTAGRIGVATVTMGPGLAQSLAALTAAVRTRSSVLLITAEVAGTAPVQAQAADQRAWVQACGASYLAVGSASELPGQLARAFGLVRNGMPCVLAISLAAFAEPAAAFVLPPPSTPPHQPPASADRQSATDLLRRAARPVVLIGRGAGANECQDRLAELVRRLGAVVLTTVQAKGETPSAGLTLGVGGMMASPLARRVLIEADLLIVVGASLDVYNTDRGAVTAAKPVIRIDRQPILDRWTPAKAAILELEGDAGSVVADLLAQLGDHHSTGWRDTALTADVVKEAGRLRSLAGLLTDDGPNPYAVVRTLDQELPADARVVVGIGHFWYYVAPYLDAAAGRSFQFGCGFASIGQGLSLAIGAAVAERDRLVVAIEGDGSMAMNIQELQTAVRFGVELLVLVLDNSGYGSEYYKLLLDGLDPETGTFDKPLDTVAVARACGVDAEQVSSVAELGPAVRKALRARGVRLVNISIARSLMSEVYERQHGALPTTTSGVHHA